MTNENNLYRKKDFSLVVLFYSLGVELIGTEKYGNAVFFIFQDKEKCEEIEKSYFSGKIKLDPRVIFQSQKTIKQLIFNN